MACSSTTTIPNTTTGPTDFLDAAHPSEWDSGAPRATDTEAPPSRRPDGGDGSASHDTGVGPTASESTGNFFSGTEDGGPETSAPGPIDDAGNTMAGLEAPAWLFSLAADGRLHNTRDPSQRYSGVLDTNQASPDARPWSKSGRRFAQATSTGITVYDVAAELTLRNTVALNGATAVLRWLGEDRILVSGGVDGGPRLWIVGIDGATREIGTTTEDAVVAYHSSAFDASTLVYSCPDNDGAYVTHRLSISETATQTPLGVYRPSPMLSATWSPDSRWLSFGISGMPDGGFYVWENAAAEPPLRVSPEGAGYTPFLGFSPSGTHLAFVSTSTQGAGELKVVVAAQPKQATVLSNNALVAPFSWGPDEWLAYSDADGGHLTQLANAAVQRQLALPKYTASCPLVWLSADELAFTRCDSDGKLVHASIGDTVVTTDIALVSPGLKKIGDDACLLTWSEDDLRLLAFNGETFTESAIDARAPTNLAVAAAGSGIAWSEGGHVHWAPVSDCRFAAPAALVDAHPTDVKALEFLVPN